MKESEDTVLTRGRRWKPGEERYLRELYKVGVPAAEIAARLGKTVPGVYDKIRNLGLEDDKAALFFPSSLSSLSSSPASLSNEKPGDEGTSSDPLPAVGADVGKVSSEPSSPVSPAAVPAALSSPEEALAKMAAAVVALEQPGLGRLEMQRLKCIILGTEKFLALFERVAELRRLEERLLELERQYRELAKKS